MARPNKLIQFYLTNICNSRCNTCNIWRNSSFSLLELDASKVIEIIKSYPNADYVFGGGEFTLYTQRHQLLYWCEEHNINYTVLTNCVNINLVKDLLNEHNVKNLTISCDGIMHDDIRCVQGNRKNIEEVITFYKDKIDNIKISYTLSAFNEKYIDEDMKYFKMLGFDKIYFCIAKDMELLKTSGKVSPSYCSLKYFYQKYKDMLYDKDAQLLENLLKDKMNKCDSTKSVHTVYSNGDIVVCQSYLSNHKLGNIYRDNFKDVIESFEGIEWCKYERDCELVCQRRYDYEDRI